MLEPLPYYTLNKKHIFQQTSQFVIHFNIFMLKMTYLSISEYLSLNAEIHQNKI